MSASAGVQAEASKEARANVRAFSVACDDNGACHLFRRVLR